MEEAKDRSRTNQNHSLAVYRGEVAVSALIVSFCKQGQERGQAFEDASRL